MVLPLWKQFAVSCKTKYTLTIQPIKYTLGHLFQRNGGGYPHKNLPANVHSNVISNNWKQKQMSFSGVNKPWWYIRTVEYTTQK